MLSLALLPVVATAVFLLLSHRVEAANKFWIASSPGNFNDDANWSLASGGPANTTAPGPSDTVFFDANGLGNCTITSNATLESLTIGSGYNGAITVASGVTVTVGSTGFAQSGGTFNGGSSDIDVNGNFLLQGTGVFNSTTGTLFLGSAFDHNTSTNPGGTFNHNNGTVTFDGSFGGINSELSGTLFNNVNFNHLSQRVVFNTQGGGPTMTVLGALALNDGQLFGNRIEARGSLTISPNFDGAPVNHATLVIANGSGPRTITVAAGTNMLNVILNDPNATIQTTGSGTLDWRTLALQAGTINQGGVDFVFPPGLTLAYSQSGGAFNGGSGTLDMNSSFQLSGTGVFTSTSGTLFLGADFTHDSGGTFNHNNGSVVFDGNITGGISLPGAGETFNNLSFNVPGGQRIFSSAGAMIAVGTLSLIDGTNAGGTLQPQGNMNIASTFDGGIKSRPPCHPAATGLVCRALNKSPERVSRVVLMGFESFKPGTLPTRVYVMRMQKVFPTRAILYLTVLAQLLVFSSTLFGQQPRQQTPSSKRAAPPLERPDVVIQNGHSDNIRSLAYSPDGKTLASSSADKSIRLWDVETGRLLRVLDHHRDNVTSIAFSPDGKTLASGSLDKQVMICEIKTGRVARVLSGHDDEVNAVAFSPDGKLIASGSRDHSVIIWDAATGDAPSKIDTGPSEVRAIAFSPDSKFLVSGSVDKSVRLWQLSDGNLVRTLDGHAGGVRALTFSPDSQVIASAGDDKTVKLWSRESGQLLRTLQGHSGIVTSITYRSDGKTLFSGSQDKTIRIWNTETGRTTRTIEGASNPISTIVLSPDENTLAAGSWTQVVLFNSLTGKWVRNFEGRLSKVNAVSMSPDGKMVACATGNSVKLWDSSVGGLVANLEGHTSRVNAAAFSPQGGMLATGSSDRTIKLWSLADNKVTHDLSGHQSAVTALAFSPDGNLIASGSIDKMVMIWDVRSGKLVRTLEGHYSLISALAFAPSGKMVASSGFDNSIRLWDIDTGKTVHMLQGHENDVTGVVFSPDGSILASGCRDKTVKLWNVQTGQLIRSIENHPADVLSVAFSPDGKVIAAGGYDKTVRLSDVQTGKMIRVLEGHSGPVIALTYSRDGKLIVTGSEDATAKIWSPTSGQALTTLLAFDDGREWLVVSQDGLFDGSPEGWKSILWRFASNTFDVAPVEVFFNEFYYPGLLAEILSGRKPAATLSISKLDRRQPRVKLALGDNSLSAERPVDSRQVKIKVHVTEAAPDASHKTGSGAYDVRLFRNGSLIKAWRGDVLNSQQSVTLEDTVTLVAGENNLTAYAFNRDNIKSADETLLLTGSEKLRRRGTTHILTVGINEYENPEYNLRYAIADAEVFSSTVKQAQSTLGRLSRIEEISLLDKDATKANILEAIARLSGSATGQRQDAPPALSKITPAQPEDTVMVYFAGHGLAQQDRFYLIPHDLGYKGPANALADAGLKVLLDHSISDRELEQAFEQIDAGDLLMVIDACNSGQALEAKETRRGPMNSKGLAQLAYEKGIYILTAAQSFQAALEAAELGHGFLTYALIVEGLTKSAADQWPQNGLVVVREWLDYAVERVPQMQTETLKGERGLKIAFVQGEEKVSDPTKRNVQRPRVFYRREMRSEPLVIKKAGTGVN